MCFSDWVNCCIVYCTAKQVQCKGLSTALVLHGSCSQVVILHVRHHKLV